MSLSLYAIKKFFGNGKTKVYFVFAEHTEDSYVRSSLAKKATDEVMEICSVDDIYNIGGVFNEITRLGGEGVCVACGAPVGENGTFVGNYDR